MKNKVFVIVILCCIIGFYLIISNYWRQEKILVADEEIEILMNERSLQFPGVVQQNKGWAQFLLYADGYNWLEEKSAIVSQIKLKELQQAIASLDWEIWDSVWTENENVNNLQISIEHEGTVYAPEELVQTEESLGLVNTIFIGCPYFDQIALDSNSKLNCSSCPIFPLEYKALKDKFVRESGESGYVLNDQIMPEIGDVVLVRIEISE